MSVSVEETVREVVTSAVTNARESMVTGESAMEGGDWTEVVKRGKRKRGKNLLVVKANNNDEKATSSSPLLPGGGDSRSGDSFRGAGIPALANICGNFATLRYIHAQRDDTLHLSYL